MPQPNSPEAVGFSSERLDRAYRFLDNAVQSGRIPGAAILVTRHGVPVAPRCFGRMYLEPDSPPIQSDTIFLVASVTKPVTVAAVMLLVERGKLLLDDLVCSIIPEFGNRGKEEIKIRHLMTHTSGLPDMLPENQQLRERHAPMKEFVRRICDLELHFPPGTNIRYQSTGIAILGEIVERIEGISLPTFLRREIFQPLGMKDTSLGIGDLPTDRIAHVNVKPEEQKLDWTWNKPYWRNLGAPWGGMFSTVGDMFRFCQSFLNGGVFDDAPVFSPATVQAMTTDQTTSMPDIPQHVKYGQIWGLGWRLQPASGWSYFGDLISPGAYGHGGATGTVVWSDPVREMVCVLFTTQPSASSEGLLGRYSNLVAASAI
ncbi:MAG: serine hydrolase [Candidatus Poribacteria bacterium]|nr:serine hydrolase [Candidatus Poribacteria bacterium]